MNAETSFSISNPSDARRVPEFSGYDIFGSTNSLRSDEFDSTSLYSSYSAGSTASVGSSVEASDPLRSNPLAYDDFGYYKGPESVVDDSISLLSETDSVAQAAAVGSGAASTALSGISSAAGPLGLAFMVSQQLGQATNSVLTSSQESANTERFLANSTQHGLNVGLNANLIQAANDQTARSQSLWGSAGSLFGPIGALIGHAVAGTVSANPSLLQTSNSFQGAVNPQQSGIVASQSTVSPGQSTMDTGAG